MWFNYENFNEDFYVENDEKIETIPDKKIIEKIMRNIGIGNKEKITMFEILKTSKKKIEKISSK